MKTGISPLVCSFFLLVSNSFALESRIQWLSPELSPFGDTGTISSTMPQFSEGLMVVYEHQEGNQDEILCGYMDIGGELQIKPLFSDAKPFSEGFAAVEQEVLLAEVEERLGVDKHSADDTPGIMPPDDRPPWTNRYGYIDYQGETVVLPTYLSASPFSQGLAAVELTENQWGYIDTEGTLVFGGDFLWAGTFSHGFAVVQGEEGYGLMNLQGEFVLEPRFELILESDDLVAVYPVVEEGKYGLMNPSGQWVIAPIYDSMIAPEEEIVLVELEGKWGYFDILGTQITEIQGETASSFWEGTAWMALEEGFSFLDTNGHAFLLKEEMEEVSVFSGGYARGYDGAFYGFFDRTGTEVLPFVYEDAIPITNGVGFVFDGTQWGMFTSTHRSSDWAVDYVNQVKELGMIPLYFQGIDLSEPIHRTQFVSLVVTLYELISQSHEIPTATNLVPSFLPALEENPFQDTRDPWVRRAYGLNLTLGISDTVFGAYATLNREQAATMLVTLYERLTGEVLVPQGAPNFADHEEISSWAREKVYILAEKGILTGVGNNYFAPQDPISGESALVMALALYHEFSNGSL